MNKGETKRIKAELAIPAIPVSGPLNRMWNLKEIRQLIWEEEHRFDEMIYGKQVRAVKAVER